MLGTASSFSVFVENDFGANGSDCEGRIACGGGANLGEMEFYSTNSSEYASVIVGRGPLQQFDSNNKIFVVGTKVKDSDIKVNGTVYKKDLIDFSTEFSYLRNTSLNLAAKENGTVNIEILGANILLSAEQIVITILQLIHLFLIQISVLLISKFQRILIV